MARTWSVHQRVDIGGSFPLLTRQFAQNNAFTVVYIATVAGVIYSYDGSSVTDISGATFTSGTVLGICNFGGSIYVAWNNSGGVARVSRWDGGTTWTEIYTPTNEEIHDPVSVSSERVIAADASRMIIKINQTASPFENRLMATTNGTSWTAQTVSSSTIDLIRDPQNLGGLSDGNNYGELLSQYSTDSATLKTIKHSAGNDWAELTSTGYAFSNIQLVGYFDDKSFYEERVVTNFNLRYSTDWGDTLNATGAPTSGSIGNYTHFLTYIASDAMMLHVGTNTNTAYTWNTGTNQFDVDGTCGTSDDILGFFRIGSTIYAICDDDDVGGNDLAIYEGGSVVVPVSPYTLTHSAGGIPGTII